MTPILAELIVQQCTSNLYSSYDSTQPQQLPYVSSCFLHKIPNMFCSSS